MEVSGELIDLRADLFCMVRIQICGFQHGDIIKRVNRKVLADCRFRFFRSSESAEKVCPESSRLDIVRILHKAFFREFQCTLKVSSHRLNARQIIEAHLLLLIGPGRLIECIKRLIIALLIKQG